MPETMTGYTAEDQAIADSIHRKLNPTEKVPAEKAPPPVTDRLNPPPQQFEPDQLGHTPETAEGDAPAEGETPPAVEGEAAPEWQPRLESAIAEAQAAGADLGTLPIKLKVTVKDDTGNDIEEEVDFNERKSGYMRHADYTRKTQQIAAERKAIPQKLSQAEEAITQTRNDFVQRLQYMQAALVQAVAPELGGVDFNRLSQENPTEYVRLNQRAQQVNATLGAIQKQIADANTQAARQSAAAKSKAAAESVEMLNRELPGGWNEGIYQKLTQGAVKHYGYTPEEFRTVIDARMMLMANDALAYRELKEGKPLAQQKVGKAPLAVRPGATATNAEKNRTELDRLRGKAQKSGSVDDAMALMQAKRGAQNRR